VAKKILYFYSAESSFVRKDLDILQSAYEVRPFLFRVASKKNLPFTMLRQKLFLLRHIRSASLVVCQFAGLHAVLPVLFAKLTGKRSVIVAGGTDCVGFPSINYGNFASGFNRGLTTYVYNNCHLILPVHDTLVDYAYTYTGDDFPRQGIKYFMPRLRTPVEVISNGYDSELWSPRPVERKENTFVTVVAYNNSRFTEKLKGLDLFKGLARALPQCTFYIIGGGGTLKKGELPNLHYIGNLQPEELIAKLSSCRFYVQLSISEGFPNGLSEAMLCGCFPIVSAVGGMPDIIGDCGLVVPRRDQDLVNRLVRETLERKDLEETSIKARQRVASRYDLSLRKKRLLDALGRLV
jgi:glycosyltransferase involved in cell wall biosynthesis